MAANPWAGTKRPEYSSAPAGGGLQARTNHAPAAPTRPLPAIGRLRLQFLPDFSTRTGNAMGRLMAIEGRKSAQDARRGKIFTKVIRELTVAARAGGGDPKANPRLRLAMDRGLAVNMARDVMERAIKKATGELEGVSYEEIRYEGYAPGGVAVIVDCMTDNKVRTVADVRHAFTKCGGNLGTDGSVSFMFKRLGVLSYLPGTSQDAIENAAIEAGAEDIVVYPDDGTIDVLTSPDNFEAVKHAMEAAGLPPEHAEVGLRADNDIAVSGETAQAVLKMIHMLEDLDDVQNVYSNADVKA
jgi:YebC/PmpR family DNA-binding regulatory protein